MTFLPVAQPESLRSSEKFKITVSIGVVEASDEAQEQMLMRRADEALQSAKDEGCDRVITRTAMRYAA